MVFRVIHRMAGAFKGHPPMVSQPGPASGRLNVSSPPKGRGFHVRFSDNGPEMVAQQLITFFKDQGIHPGRIVPGKPGQNDCNESFNGTFRRECLDAERFHSLTDARVVIEDWRLHYNHDQPHSALGYYTPATAYWGIASRALVSRGLSDLEPEKSRHTIGREATIAARHDSEIEAVGVSSSVKKKGIPRKT